MKAWAALSLRGRFVLLALLPLLASLALIAFAVRQQESELAEREHALVRASYMDARRTELKHYVDLAVSTVKPLLGQAGGQQQALQLLSSLDYGPDGYFFVYDLEGRVLMHSRQPELIGQNLWGLRDPVAATWSTCGASRPAASWRPSWAMSSRCRSGSGCWAPACISTASRRPWPRWSTARARTSPRPCCGWARWPCSAWR
jgi:hypothetical protein